MKIDFSDSLVFEDKEIIFDKNINFIFGNNGTGKSTIARFIEEQSDESDVRLFQGFKSVVGENKELNAVILGNRNLDINKKIEGKEGLIQEKKIELDDVLEQITESEEENIYTKKKEKEVKFNAKEKKIDNFFRRAGAKIKNIKDPSIAKTSYNKLDFEDDSSIAKRLEAEDLKLNRKILDTKIKNAPQIKFPQEKMDLFLNKVNNILVNQVKEPISISRLNNDNEKIEFAKQGLKIHKKSDICSFCNNPVKDEVFDELNTFFSMKDIKDFQSKIQMLIKELESYIKNINIISIDVDNFYPEYNKAVTDLKINFESIRDEHLSFIEILIDELNKKSLSVFKPSLEVKLKTPNNFKSIEKLYDEIVLENNNNDLDQKQAQARKNIRLHHVQKELDDFDYNSKIAILGELENNMEEVKEEYLKKETDANEIKKEIRRIKKERNKLQTKTKNEVKLALNINKKLRHHLPFELQHIKNKKEKGLYKIKL